MFEKCSNYKQQFELRLESQRSYSNAKLFLFGQDKFYLLLGFELAPLDPKADDIPYTICHFASTR